MKKSIFILFCSICISLLFSACEINLSTARITDVKMCTSLSDNQCLADNNSFTTNEAEIYISCTLKNAPENTDVQFSWLYMAQQDPFTIDQVVLSSGDQLGSLQLQSSLSKPNNGWPRGAYEVQIQIMGTEKAVIVKQFIVE